MGRKSTSKKLMEYEGGHGWWWKMSITITHSIAYQTLNARQRDLYRMCREQVNWDMKKENSPHTDYPNIKEYEYPEVIYMTRGIVAKENNAYHSAKGTFNSHAFYDDLGALVDVGLLERLNHVGLDRERAIYKLCFKGDKWFEENYDKNVKERERQKAETGKRIKERKRSKEKQTNDE